MFATLQKEYAVLYYIHTVLEQSSNNGFLHELYTESNIRRILETLIDNKTKGQQTVNVGKVISRVMPSINIDTLVDPNAPNAKFNMLPYSTVSLMELYAGKAINSALADMKRRVFVEDITDARDGMAAYFVSTFGSKYMNGDTFVQFVTLDKHPSIEEIARSIHERFPNSHMFDGANGMPEVEEILEPYSTKMSKSQFTNKDLNALFVFIKKKYNNFLNKISLTAGIDAVLQSKEQASRLPSFDEQRESHESDVKGKVMSTPRIGNFFKDASRTRFVGTMKYTRNGTLDDTGERANVVQLTLRKQDRTDDGNVDRYTQFISVLNKLLAIESLPPVRTGTYKDLGTVILTEEQYHALFPEYFVTVGILKEKVTNASEMNGTTMKSGDAAENVVDRYTGEDKYENDDEESFDSNALTVGKTKKLMIAKMLATLNGDPESVPDQLDPTQIPNSTIYEMNKILVSELFNSSYGNIEALVSFLTTGRLPPEMQSREKELVSLKNAYLSEAESDRKAFAERDSRVKAFATILSGLSRLAKMDPQSVYAKKHGNPFNTDTAESAKTPTRVSIDGKTYVLNNLQSVVKTMVEHAKGGEFIESTPIATGNPTNAAIDFLKNSGLLEFDGKTYLLDTDTTTIKSVIDGMNWSSLPTIHHGMMADALRNCSYIYKHNGWVPMTTAELEANKFSPIRENSKTKDASDDTKKLVSTIERLQGRIRPYIFKLKDINDIIGLIKTDFHIASLDMVETPVVNDGTLSVAEGTMRMIGTDNSAESIDALSQGYYINHVISQYDDAAEKACNDIRQALLENKLLTEQTQKRLSSEVNHSGRKLAIINRIFEGKRQSPGGTVAENGVQIETRDIFILAQSIVNLYNKSRRDLSSEEPDVAGMFAEIGYVKTDDLTQMANGNAPTGKTYTENGSGCPTEFMLNAYLIDVLFDAVYMTTKYFGIQGQETYSAQEVHGMTEIEHMKRYIQDNIGITVAGNINYKQLLTTINQRLDMLFLTPMLNAVAAMIVNNTQITQLTVGAYNKMHGKTTHSTSEKVLSDVSSQQDDNMSSESDRSDYLNKFYGVR